MQRRIGFFLAVLLFSSFCSGGAMSCFDLANGGFYRISANRYMSATALYLSTRFDKEKMNFDIFRATIADWLHRFKVVKLTGEKGWNEVFETRKLHFDAEGIFRVDWLGQRVRIVRFSTLFNRFMKDGDSKISFQKLDEDIEGLITYNKDANYFLPSLFLGAKSVRFDGRSYLPIDLHLLKSSFPKGFLIMRKGGAFKRYEFNPRSLQLNINGDVFLKGSFIYNIFEARMEDSSIYAMKFWNPNL